MAYNLHTAAVNISRLFSPCWEHAPFVLELYDGSDRSGDLFSTNLCRRAGDFGEDRWLTKNPSTPQRWEPRSAFRLPRIDVPENVLKIDTKLESHLRGGNRTKVKLASRGLRRTRERVDSKLLRQRKFLEAFQEFVVDSLLDIDS